MLGGLGGLNLKIFEFESYLKISHSLKTKDLSSNLEPARG